jgi:hypothetical protein
VIILVVLVLALFLAGFVGLATDYTNLWAHRQKARGVADAACQAAGADLLLFAEGQATGKANFTPGTAFDCSSNLAAAPCKYAQFNGYDSAGLQTDQASTSVSLTFPSSLPGIPPLPPEYGVAVPYVTVTATERVPLFLSKLFSRTKTVDVKAVASCGLVPVAAPTPIVVLHPTKSTALGSTGNATIVIWGGPQKSLQINSKDSLALNVGNNNLIDLHLAGPNKTGGDIDVFGGPSVATPASAFRLGTTGKWVSPAAPTSDPYITIATPGKPANAANPTSVALGQNGCPDPSGCDEYSPGFYPSGIDVKNRTAIFDPGLYYLNGPLVFDTGSTSRQSTALGDGTKGVIFYLSGSNTVSVASNTGSAAGCTQLSPTPKPIKCIVSYKIDGSTQFNGDSHTFQSKGIASLPLQCPGGAPNPSLVPATIDGNILLGPCTGSYGDPAKLYRGFLFFQDRSKAAAPAWGGGGQFLLAGLMYFHQCNASGTGKNCSAPGSGGYGTTFNMGGGSGASAYTIGNIVTDTLMLKGGTEIDMILNPNASTSILKVQMLQ